MTYENRFQVRRREELSDAGEITLRSRSALSRRRRAPQFLRQPRFLRRRRRWTSLFSVVVFLCKVSHFIIVTITLRVYRLHRASDRNSGDDPLSSFRFVHLGFLWKTHFFCFFYFLGLFSDLQRKNRAKSFFGFKRIRTKKREWNNGMGFWSANIRRR